MSVTKTGKALKNLKFRVSLLEIDLETAKDILVGKDFMEAAKLKDEIKILVDAYEKQIELNKRQNIKIKNQRGILKVLLRKQGDAK